MDSCLEPQSQEGNRKHSRKEKVRLACLTPTHQNVSEVSLQSAKQTIKRFNVKFFRKSNRFWEMSENSTLEMF